ncbi:hypothetical protein L6164_002291 [Bauhinia variegata]|uniref:Uncharacterized protein n=1 Tax=Bauhinia variegata TaxID=167791 RepID=A0ACB9PXJ7_BAUVA|nr:hypothetical protein L6164_002291 [Bauhinia variegata]
MKLEKLEVLSCGIDVIVAKEEGLEETIDFVFPVLCSIKFCHLNNLRSLYPGKHTSKWPSLKDVDIYNCKKLGIFALALPLFQETKEEDVLDVQCRQPLFFVEKVIPNLERLALNYKDAMMIWEGQYQDKLHNVKSLVLRCFYEQLPTLMGSFLQIFANLEKLEIGDSSCEMIFPREGVSDRNTGMNIQIRQLMLAALKQLKYIWSKDSSLIDSLSGNLESLEVLYCSSLKNLVPPSICFENLTIMYVDGCEGLIYLITSSTAKSLVQLKTMTIVNCRALEHVICTDEEEEVEAEISFESLESLELTSLSRLKNFSSGEHTLIFPSLDVLKISGCPKMDMFSPGVLMAPVLNAVTMEEGKKRWKDGLNSTIGQLFQEKVAFHGFKLLELSEYPELKELWYDGPYSHGGHHIFANLKSLGVKKCDFLSDVLFSSNLLQVLCNLEELEVTDCASLEALTDVKGVNGKEMQMKEISQLKKLKLSGLPNLKHIWNKEIHRIISFKNLLTVDVVDCENLESVFPVSLSKDLVQLQEVRIVSSGIVEIFSTEDGLEECRFDLPQLTKLALCNLIKLKCFYPGRHILDCPSLKHLNIYHCGTLQTFTFDHSVFQQAYGMGEDEFAQVLFPLEKVCTKLELMALNKNDMKRITDDNYDESLFDKIVDLRIQCFHETQDDLPIDFLQRFPNLVRLGVGCCSFNSLFPMKGVGHHHIGAPLQIRELLLYKMEHLKYIWEEEILSSGHAETLDSLPSSISVKNLTFLLVADCKELVYLLTKSIAKSLLQLKSIYIENCESMVDVVKNDEEAAEEIITFKNLEDLTLTSLSSLKSFCSGKQTFIFPSLVLLHVKGCPKMNIFSSGVVTAPFLQSVTVKDERKHWKGDLNTTIQQLFNGKVCKPKMIGS